MKKFNSLSSLILLVFILSSFQFLCPKTAAALKGACAKVNITPPVGTWLTGFSSRTKPSDNVADELHAKTIVLNDGETTIAIVSTDLLWISLDITNRIRKLVEEQTGIPENNVLISASHTHFGPKIFERDIMGPVDPENKPDKAYTHTLINKIAGAVSIAHKNMQNAKIGAAKGEIPEIVFNRRPKRKDGSIKMTWTIPESETLHQPIIETKTVGAQKITTNIPSNNPELAFGIIDPEVCILKLENTSGEIIGSLINFACHPSSGTGYPDWFYSLSADYPGYAMKVIENVEGGICLFSLGTAADLTAIKRGQKPRIQLGRALGGEVLRRLQFVPTTGDVTINALKKSVKLPLKKVLPEYKVREIDVEKKADYLTTEIQIIKIGDIYILGLPGEIMVNMGLEIKRKSGIKNLFIITLSNDAVGYVCDAKTYEDGGYEPNEATCLAEGAGEIIIKESLNIINQIKQIK